MDFVFNLYKATPFGDADECTLTVKGGHGKIYGDPIVVDFPPPTRTARKGGE